MLPPLVVAAACLHLPVAAVRPAIRAEPDSSALRSSIRIDAGEGLPREVPVIRSRNRRGAIELPDTARTDDRDRGDAPVRYLVDLRDQLDFERAAALLAGRSPSRASQRGWVIEGLAAIAARGQRRLLPILEQLQRNGEIASFTQVSIVNRLVVAARRRAIRTLAESAEVESITPEVQAEAALQDAASVPGTGDSGPGWALDAIGAPQAWRMGIDGTGVTVGIIDSGASGLHEQLRGNFRGGPASWFDPLHETSQPTDFQTGHGTAVLSCAVGQSRSAVACGAAPGARWVAAVGLNGGRYDNVLVTRAADWMLNVAQPDVLVIPFRLPGTGCDDSLRRMVNAFRAAQIVVVFAAGNGGPDPRTDVSPANYTQLFPGSSNALSVGAVDRARKGEPRSSRGPSRCGGTLFPQIVAPGANVAVAGAAGITLYQRATGTSFAAGFAAGASALLLQEFPRARAEQIEEALRQSAIDLGPPGPDSTYGHGLVSVPRAIEYLKTRLLSQ